MEKIEFQKMYELERTHWWFKGKRKIIQSMLNHFIIKKQRSKLNVNFNSKQFNILDVGCGTGIVLKILQNYGQIYGIDISEDAVDFCKKRGLNNVLKGDILNLPYKDNTFDLITCLDVLYHKSIKSDVAVLNELYRICKKEGFLIITDSACKSLWSKHDLSVHARERYSKKDLIHKVKSSGFIIQKISYYNFILFPLILLIRKFENIFLKNKPINSNVKKTNKLFNSVLYFIFIIESYFLKLINFPIGVSIICIAKKTDIKKP